jgi:tyrosyl-tRNA synthetase
LKENAISVNKIKINSDYIIKEADLIADQYVLLQRGKKNYFILKLED